MSSASGRYQSRFFNFIHQQSRRISEQCDRAVRQVRYATSWIAPAVVYPLYRLFRSTRISLSPTQQNAPQLNADYPATSTPDVDTPIQHVLDVGSPVPTPKKSFFAWFTPQAFMRLVTRRRELDTVDTQITSTLPESEIQGIATQLTTRTLVLVTATNQTLDVLTPQQQQNLQATILREVAAYWRYQRLLHAAPAKTLNGSVEAPLAYFDQGLAQIEANSLTLASKVAIAIQRWQLSDKISTAPADVDRASFQQQGLNVLKLVWAAIDFFFGSRSVAVPKSQSSPSLPTSQQKAFAYCRIPKLPAADAIEDPWLSWSDLFGESVETKPLTAPQTNKTLPENTSYSLYTKLQNRWRRLHPKTIISAIVKIKQHQVGAIASSNSSVLQPNNTTFDPTQANPTADWIDISATTMGYVKHPLEQLLAWLDQAMLWLEKVLFKVWRWLSRLTLKRTQ